MANEIGQVETSGTYPSHGQGTNQRMRVNRRGVGLSLPEFQEMVAQGNVFSINVGTASTVNAFTETAYDEDQPQFGLDIPSGTTVIPLAITAYFQDQAGTDNECFFRMDDGLLGAGTSTATTIVNLLQGASDVQRASRCTARRQYTGNASGITTGPEFFRWGNPFAVDATEGDMNVRWSAHDQGFAPMAQGEASISAYFLATSTALSGFFTFTWAEFLTNET